jgi:hypothetical protein
MESQLELQLEQYKSEGFFLEATTPLDLNLPSNPSNKQANK